MQSFPSAALSATRILRGGPKMNLIEGYGNLQALPYPKSISFATLPILAAGRALVLVTRPAKLTFVV